MRLMLIIVEASWRKNGIRYVNIHYSCMVFTDILVIPFNRLIRNTLLYLLCNLVL